MRRISKKQIYINNFIESFESTFEIKKPTYKIDKEWINVNAECHYKITRKELTNKADAIWYGKMDGYKAAIDFADRYI